MDWMCGAGLNTFLFPDRTASMLVIHFQEKYFLSLSKQMSPDYTTIVHGGDLSSWGIKDSNDACLLLCNLCHLCEILNIDLDLLLIFEMHFAIRAVIYYFTFTFSFIFIWSKLNWPPFHLSGIFACEKMKYLEEEKMRGKVPKSSMTWLPLLLSHVQCWPCISRKTTFYLFQKKCPCTIIFLSVKLWSFLVASALKQQHKFNV